MNNILLHWYRSDLRSQDHKALDYASKNGYSVLPVYILPDECEFTLSGLPRWGEHRKNFLYQTLLNVSQYWKKQGGDLLIVRGNPADIIPQIIKKYDVAKLSFACAIAPEELEQEQALTLALKSYEVSIFKYFDDFLVHPDDLPCPIDEVPDIFSSFRKRVESNLIIRKVLEYEYPPCFQYQEKGISPEELLKENVYEYDVRSAFPFTGGELSANERIQNYFFNDKNILRYKITRNEMLGADYSSKFSPWLAFGSISPRQLYYQLKEFESQHGANDSTYWLVFELLWRDYFRYILLKYGSKIFQKKGLGIYPPPIESVKSERLFRMWIDGKTRDRFVDSCMNELAITGYMSNRGRQNVASYFVYQLKLDWRLGAEYFESMLLDYDPASNWGNWAYAAGVGNDPRQRIFNTIKQAQQYDEKGDFRKCWS